MAVTKADRIRQKKATVEPTEAYLEFEKRRQALLKEVEEDRLNNELKEKRRQEESAARPERKTQKEKKAKKSQEEGKPASPSTSTEVDKKKPEEKTLSPASSSQDGLAKKKDKEDKASKKEKKAKKSQEEGKPASPSTSTKVEEKKTEEKTPSPASSSQEGQAKKKDEDKASKKEKKAKKSQEEGKPASPSTSTEVEEKKTEEKTLSPASSSQEGQAKKKDEDKASKKEKKAKKSQEEGKPASPTTSTKVEEKKTEEKTPSPASSSQDGQVKKKDKEDKASKKEKKAKKSQEEGKPAIPTTSTEVEEKKTEEKTLSPASSSQDGQAKKKDKEDKASKKEKKAKKSQEEDKTPSSSSKQLEGQFDKMTNSQLIKALAEATKHPEFETFRKVEGMKPGEFGKTDAPDELTCFYHWLRANEEGKQEPQRKESQPSPATSSQQGGENEKNGKKKRKSESTGEEGASKKPKGETSGTLKRKASEPEGDQEKKVFKTADSKELLVERSSTLASLDLVATPQSCRRQLFASEQGSEASTSPPTSERVARIKDLSAEEKEKIQQMQKPSDMERAERKRQYSALRRAIIKEASPELVAKFSLASDKERFSMLKAWVQNQDLGEIEIEEKYRSWVANLRTDRYTTVTLFQLEKIYGKSAEAKKFIEELCRGQTGVPHPQAPNVKKARMFKVLREVIEENSSGSQTTSSASISGRVKEAAAKGLLSKQLGGLNTDVAFFNTSTGVIKSKKPKKEKSPEEECLADMKKLQKKWKQMWDDLAVCAKGLSAYNVRNSAELVSALDAHRVPASESIARVADYVNKKASEINAGEFSSLLETEKKAAATVEVDIRDAKRRISAAKGPKKRVVATKVESSDGEDDDVEESA